MNNNAGQSMFEVVIALFIIAMITVGVVSLSTNSLSNSIYSRNKSLAGKYSQEAMEWLRGQREQNTQAFITNIAANPVYCLQSLNWTNTGVCNDTEFISGTVFIRQVTFVTTIVSGKSLIEADVKTYWNDSRGYHESKSVTNFNDLRER